MKRVLLSVLTLSMLAGSAAMADPGHYGGRGRPDQRDARDWQRGDQRNNYGYYRNNGRNNDRNNGRDDGRDWHAARYPDYRAPDYRPAYWSGYRQPFRSAEYYRPYGYYPHTWIRGEQLPVAWRAADCTVYDYPAYGLQSPPVGYRWVRVNDDAVLAAIAGGVVADVAYHLFR